MFERNIKSVNDAVQYINYLKDTYWCKHLEYSIQENFNFEYSDNKTRIELLIDYINGITNLNEDIIAKLYQIEQDTIIVSQVQLETELNNLQNISLS